VIRCETIEEYVCPLVATERTAQRNQSLGAARSLLERRTKAEAR
jgi:hypothetical protein